MWQIFQDYVTELELGTENKKQNKTENKEKQSSFSWHIHRLTTSRCSDNSQIQFLTQISKRNLFILKTKQVEQNSNYKFSNYLVCSIVLENQSVLIRWIVYFCINEFTLVLLGLLKNTMLLAE